LELPRVAFDEGAGDDGCDGVVGFPWPRDGETTNKANRPARPR
jgi:hypothetical protein